MSEAATQVAIIGLACRFPASADAAAYWDRLEASQSCIAELDAANLRAAGVDPATLGPHHVARWGVAPDVEAFDAGFFGFTAREAQATDPQQRLFLHIVGEALDDAGYGRLERRPLTGLYVAPGSNDYAAMARAEPGLAHAVGDMVIEIGTAPEHIAARVAHRYDVQGPVLTIQTACSSSLVAVHHACAALLGQECDLALAGGVSLKLPQTTGYDYAPGGIGSPDGRTRSFDARANGTVGGNGAGVVVLRRLEDALRDGDDIRAVILGAAVNNDGARRAGYAAPSAAGQAEVMATALAMSDLPPAAIDYVECHGSGTPLGDAIELTALQRAFCDRDRPLLIGSVKSNIGHLREAAGIAGLIKVVLAIQRGRLPATLHFEDWHDSVGVDIGRFQPVTTCSPWTSAPGQPRRAGVSSFGLGGTNAHLILQQAPPRQTAAPTSEEQLLLLSADSVETVGQAAQQLAKRLGRPDAPDLADVAFTLKHGRATRPFRLAVVADGAAAAAALCKPARSSAAVTGRPKVAFLLAGAGDGYEGLGAGLYRSEPVFRRFMDEGIEAARPHLDRDLRTLSGLESGRSVGARDLRFLMRSVGLASSAKPEPLSLPEQHCFDVLVAYALASFWRAIGVEPDGLLGYSLGEYAAATVAGVFSLDDVMALVSGRARLLERLDQGGMLAVCLSPDALAERLPNGVSIAAITAPSVCVVAGEAPQLDALQGELSDAAIAVRRLPSRAAIHTAHMRPIAAALQELVARTPRKAPTLRLVSNLDGEAMDANAARDPTHWMRHLTEPVQLTAGLRTLIEDGCKVFIEMGPGQTLTGSALQMAGGIRLTAASSLPSVTDPRSDRATFLTAVGCCWSAGLTPDWAIMAGGGGRTALPGRIWRNQVYSVGPLGMAARRPAVEPTRNGAAGVTAPGRQAPGLTPAPSQFGSSTEAAVAGLFADATGAEAVDRESNFFELGGQSLLALQLLIRLREVFSVDLDPAMFYRHPTVQALSCHIDGLAAAQSSALADVLGPSEGIRPASMTTSWAG